MIIFFIFAIATLIGLACTFFGAYTSISEYNANNAPAKNAENTLAIGSIVIAVGVIGMLVSAIPIVF